MLKIRRLVVNNFDENTYILIDSATNKAAIVDPGMLTADECRRLDDFVAAEGIELEQIILTHGHVDHCLGISHVVSKYGAIVKGHPDDAPLLSALPAQAARFGMVGLKLEAPVLDVELKDGDKIVIGESSLEVRHVPGHSRGGIALYDAADGFVIVGDSLFSGSIGRTDLPGGDMMTLLDAIQRQLFSLPDGTTVLSGHGPNTTIGREKQTNPYFSRR